MTGIDYPTITVDGETLTVRFSLRTQYLLSLAGVDIRKPVPASDPRYLSHRLQMFAACVSENFGSAKAPDALDWSGKIPLEQWVEVEQAMNAAMGKAAAELRKNIRAATPPDSLAS
jgi:hypothetical protein